MTEDIKSKENYRNWSESQGSQVLETDMSEDFFLNLTDIIELTRYL